MQIPERRRVLQTQIRDVDCVVYNIGQLATVGAEAPDGLGLVTQAALAAQGGRIVWIGPSSDWHLRVSPAQGATLLDAQRRLVTPGFVDSHTHLVHAGQRASHRRWLHLRWHVQSLLRLWRSPVYWQACQMLRAQDKSEGTIGRS